MKRKDVKNSTPLNIEEKEELLITVNNQEDLNLLEQEAIFQAILMIRDNKKFIKNILSIAEILELHKIMFSDIWGWAGKIRKTEKNIGIDPHQILNKLDELIKNIKFRISNLKNDDLKTIIATFHHQLVFIHPFVNGNGRHARLATDLLCINLGLSESRWGEADLVENNLTRKQYIEALKRADQGDLKKLVEFIFGT